MQITIFWVISQVRTNAIFKENHGLEKIKKNILVKGQVFSYFLIDCFGNKCTSYEWKWKKLVFV